MGHSRLIKVTIVNFSTKEPKKAWANLSKNDAYNLISCDPFQWFFSNDFGIFIGTGSRQN